MSLQLRDHEETGCPKAHRPGKLAIQQASSMQTSLGSKSVPCAYGWLPAQQIIMQVWSLENRKDEALQP